MGLLDSVLGSVLGGGVQQPAGGSGALINIVASLLAQSRPPDASGAAAGGLAGLAEQFQRGGLGEVMNSWIGSGQNLPVSPEQLGKVLGGDMLDKLTQHTGMNTGDLLGQLAQILPKMVDHATPDGQIPAGGIGDVAALLNRFTAAR